MACGLPVITSAQNGGSQIITDGVDGYVLNDPLDAAKLAKQIQAISQQPDLCRDIGLKAAYTARSYTWENNAERTWSFLMEVFNK